MNQQELHESIKKLQATMHTALNDHERDLFGDLLARMIKTGRGTDAATELSAQAAEFEANHPKLAPSLREVLDVLNKLGI
jgi:hypothetical protein